MLPAPLCQLLIYFALGSLARNQAEGVGSPGLQDLAEGRKTMADWHLGEIVEVNVCEQNDTLLLCYIELD